MDTSARELPNNDVTGGDLPAASHPFPVPRRRLLEEEFTEPPRWRRRALGGSLATAILGLAAITWLKPRPPEAPPAPAAEITATPVRPPDAAVDIYFTPSQPDTPLPLTNDFPPLPVAPVSLDDLFGSDSE